MCSAGVEVPVAVVKEKEESWAQTKTMCSLNKAAAVAKHSLGFVLCTAPVSCVSLCVPPLVSRVPPLVSCVLHQCPVCHP